MKHFNKTFVIMMLGADDENECVGVPAVEPVVMALDVNKEPIVTMRFLPHDYFTTSKLTIRIAKARYPFRNGVASSVAEQEPNAGELINFMKQYKQERKELYDYARDKAHDVFITESAEHGCMKRTDLQAASNFRMLKHIYSRKISPEVLKAMYEIQYGVWKRMGNYSLVWEKDYMQNKMHCTYMDLPDEESNVRKRYHEGGSVRELIVGKQGDLVKELQHASRRAFHMFVGKNQNGATLFHNQYNSCPL